MSGNSLFGNVTNYHGNTYGDINATVTDLGGTIGLYTIHPCPKHTWKT